MQCALGRSTSRDARSPYITMARAIPTCNGPWIFQHCLLQRGELALSVGRTYFYDQYNEVRANVGAVSSDMEYFAGFELSLRGSPIALVFIVTHSSHHETYAYLYEFSFVFDDRQMAMLAIGLQQDALSEHSCFLNQHLRNIRCDTSDINLVCLANPF